MPEKTNPILSRWRRVVLERTDDPALLAPDGRVLRTFGGMDREADRWRDLLAAEDACGGTVALQLGQVPEWPVVLLAAWRLGRTVVVLDLELGGDRLERTEALCGVTLRVQRSASGPVLQSRKFSPLAWPGPAPHLLKLTSGTSGEVRAIRFTAAQLLADCDAVCETMGIRADDRNYGVISFAHSYGFSNLITPLVCRGVPLVVAGDLIPRAVMEGLEKSRATVFPAVPALFRSLAGYSPPPMPLRLCISAGTLLPGDVARDFRTSWGRKVHSFYGSSECGGICYDSGPDPEPPAGFVGRPLKGVRILRRAGEDPALVEVCSAAVGEGYLPATADDALNNGVFRPADLLTDTGTGYVITGRLLGVINVAGRKVHPHEIERVLRGCPGVREVAVVGVPAAARGEEVAACVAGEVSVEALRVHCGLHLSSWQIPRRWKIVEALPVNARGKTSRDAVVALVSRDV